MNPRKRLMWKLKARAANKSATETVVETPTWIPKTVASVETKTSDVVVPAPVLGAPKVTTVETDTTVAPKVTKKTVKSVRKTTKTKTTATKSTTTAAD